MMSLKYRLGISLLILRLGVAAVFLVWSIDRISNYEHNSRVMSHYYKLDLSPEMLTMVGLVQLGVIIAFLVGIKKFWSYGAILVMHTGTTVASMHRLIPPFERHQLLYYGALPMLGACIALFLLREYDVLLSLPNGSKKPFEDQ